MVGISMKREDELQGEGQELFKYPVFTIPLMATRVLLLILGNVLEEVPLVGEIKRHSRKQKCRHHIPLKHWMR